MIIFRSENKSLKTCMINTLIFWIFVHKISIFYFQLKVYSDFKTLDSCLCFSFTLLWLFSYHLLLVKIGFEISLLNASGGFVRTRMFLFFHFLLSFLAFFLKKFIDFFLKITVKLAFFEISSLKWRKIMGRFSGIPISLLTKRINPK